MHYSDHGYFPAENIRVGGVYFVPMHIENVGSQVFYIPFEVLCVTGDGVYEVKPLTESSVFWLRACSLFDKR
jgi:hypothetical protein